MAHPSGAWQASANVGPLDRAVRIVLGLALLALVVIGPESLWGLIGLIPLLTGLAGYCPLYALLDFSTVGTPHGSTAREAHAARSADRSGAP